MYGTETWKGYFINNLIKDLNYTNYLELGVASGETWNQVFCKNKVGVDIDQNIKIPGVIIETTDEYFKTTVKRSKFDLIYIDSYHEKNQVKKDFYNSWKCLNPGGLVVFHDINPQTKSGTSQSAHGNCFEFWIELVNKYPDKVSTFSGGTICGQIDTVGLWFKTDEKVKSTDIKIIDNTYEYFVENHFKYIDNLELEYDKIITRALGK